jgi:hypothetical protein
VPRRRRPNVGDVVQIDLPGGRYASGRVLRDASIAIYGRVSDLPAEPPIGSRDYAFVVGVYDDAVSAWPVVGHDPSRNADDDWPPPNVINDSITGEVSIYHKGVIRPASGEECEGLEPAAVWDSHHIIERITGPPDAQ